MPPYPQAGWPIRTRFFVVFTISELNLDDDRTDLGRMETTTSRKTWAAPYAVAALVLALLAVGVVLFASPSSDAADGRFGMQRDVIRATAGDELAGRLLLPTDVDAADVRWTVTAGGETLARGSGATWRVTAPAEGSATLAASVSGSDLETSTKITVLPVDEVLGRGMTVTGRVLVDGGRAVQGEALVQGVEVDATGGSFAFTALARLDGGLSGRVQLEGTKLTLRSERGEGGQVRNVVELDRAAGTDEQLLVADVEHLDGTRYVEVETPDAVAMVKGTRFWVRLDERGTDVAVDHGWVVVERQATADDGEVDVETIDVRDERSTFVPRVPSDGAAPVEPLVVTEVTDFEGVVEEHREQVRDDLRERDEATEVAPPPSPRGPAPVGDRTPGTTVGGGSGQARPCEPRCTAPIGGTTQPPTTGSGSSATTTRPPCPATGCPQPPNGTTLPPKTTCADTDCPRPSGTTQPPPGSNCPATGCTPPPSGTTQPPSGTSPTCPATGCPAPSGTTQPPPNTTCPATGCPSPSGTTGGSGSTSGSSGTCTAANCPPPSNTCTSANGCTAPSCPTTGCTAPSTANSTQTEPKDRSRAA
jgi:hypothetical protein